METIQDYRAPYISMFAGIETHRCLFLSAPHSVVHGKRRRSESGQTLPRQPYSVEAQFSVFMTVHPYAN